MDKWEDTIMKDKQIVITKQPNFAYISCSDYSVWVEERDKRIALAQAKTTWDIAFKAGEDKGYSKGFDKVVEWIELNATDAIAVKDSDTSQEMTIRAIPEDKWQAFLKERGK